MLGKALRIAYSAAFLGLILLIDAFRNKCEAQNRLKHEPEEDT